MKPICQVLVWLAVVFFVAAQMNAQPPAAGSEEGAVAQMEKLGGKLLAKGYKATWSPDGKRVVFGRHSEGIRLETGGGVAIVDVETGKITQLVPSGKDPAWGPADGKFIAYVSGGYATNEEVWVVEASGENPRKLAQGGFPCWAPDGRTLYFHSRTQRKLMTIRADAEKPEATEVMDMPCWYPAISPDGKQVAYRSGSRLFIADLASAKVVKTYPMPPGGRGFLGDWSADGTQIGFGGFGSHDVIGLWVLDLKSGQAARLSTGSFTMPAWSRDGSKMVFDHRPGGVSEIWMLQTKALEGLELEEIPADRYALPDGGVDELLKFIKDLKGYTPETSGEKSEYRLKAPRVLRTAAERILKVEKDEWSEAYQTALRVMLEDRLRTIGSARSSEQRRTVDFIKTFLTAKLQRKLDPPDVNLAMSAARALENKSNKALAVAAYREFAALIAKSDDEELLKTAKTMEKAAQRLEDSAPEE
jgi:hypothetical protein